MIRTKYNFKLWLRKTYPDIEATPIYGLPAYLLNKAMDPLHMYEYNVQQLPNGKYIVFIGISPEDVPAMLQMYKANGTTRPEKPFLPTTFASFENWLKRHNIKPLHRTFIQRQTANTTLFTNNDNPQWNTRHTWYQYEFEADTFTDTQLNIIPHTITENNTIVLLIKASSSSYVSKRQLFLQKFSTMQPIYEQLVACCANEEWDTATQLCAQYMSIQFEYDGTVDKEQLKEAYANGQLSSFTRIKGNLHPLETVE